MENLTFRERQVLLELLKNARISDQALATKLGTSRPTIIKIRQRLERTLIKRYSATVDFADAGLHVIATSFFRWDDFSKKKEMEAVFDYIKKLPFVIRFNSGVGMGSMTMVIVSLHETIEEYERFWKELQEKGGANITEVQVFLGSTKDMLKKYNITDMFIHHLQNQNDTTSTKEMTRTGDKRKNSPDRI